MQSQLVKKYAQLAKQNLLGVYSPVIYPQPVHFPPAYSAPVHLPAP